MSDCCSSDGDSTNNSIKTTANTPSKSKCPSVAHAKEQNCAKVAYETVLHHIKEPWQHKITEQAYYFCDDPACDVVYFGLDEVILEKSQVRTVIGIKEPQLDDALICYCFDVSNAQARLNVSAYEFVLEQTKKSNCSCKTRNPSGHCCLKDFKKI